MNQKQLYVVLTILIVITIFKHFNSNAIEAPKPLPTITVPVPKIDHSIDKIYDNLGEAKQRANHANKKILLIFSAEWCPYCKVLKKDLPDIIQNNKHIICVIDIEQHRSLVKEFQIKRLPTSIIIDGDKEENRTSGYNKKAYVDWLQQF